MTGHVSDAELVKSWARLLIAVACLVLGAATTLLALSPSLADAQPQQADPVVFVPGILGSILSDNNGVVWGDVKNSWRRFHELQLPIDPSQTKLRAVGILENVSVLGPLQIGQYSGLLKTFAELGFRKDDNLFLFPYDWRRSNFDSAIELRNHIERTPALKGRKFNIVAHSMGGLVAQVYIKRFGGDARVNRLITLATPYLGSPNALHILLQGLGTLGNVVVGGRQKVFEVVFSFPSLYELLPTYQNCCILGAPNDPRRRPLPTLLDPQVWWTYGWVPTGFQSGQRRAFVENALYRAAELRDLLAKPQPEGVKLYKVAGDLVDTYTRVYLESSTGSPVRWDRFGGDGTVPLWSGAGGDVSNAEAAIHVHATIFDDPHVKLALKRKIQPYVVLEDYGLQTVTAFALAGTEGRLVKLSGIGVSTDDSYYLPGQLITVTADLRDEDDTAVAGVRVRVDITSTNDPTASEPTKQAALFAGDVYVARIQAPAMSGVFRVNVDIPGAGTFDKYIVVLETDP